MSKYEPGPWRKGGGVRFVDDPGNPHFIELEMGTDIWHVDETEEKSPVFELADWFDGNSIALAAAAPELLAIVREIAFGDRDVTGPAQALITRLDKEFE